MGIPIGNYISHYGSGMDADEFIRQNADPIFLHENQMWELMDEENIMTDVEVCHDHPLF